jgi:hypothetical protein
MADVRTKHNQQRRSNDGYVASDLEKKECGIGHWVLRPGHIKRGAHNFNRDPNLENIINQTV